MTESTIEIRPLQVTQENHAELDSVTASASPVRFNKVLDKMFDVNRILEELLGSDHVDWAGQYATWLNRMGFQHQTENGWWNLTAINPENIKAFVEYMSTESGEGFVSRADLAKNIISAVATAGKFTSTCETVYELVDCLVASENHNGS